MAATLAAESNSIKSTSKVKLIARIRGFTTKEQNSEPWISVDDTCHPVVVSFGDQSNRDVHEVDSYYGQSEDNYAIYLQEIKPSLPSVYGGQNLTVIGFGARGSGKTYTIQGNEKDQGLAALAANDILSGADGNGMSISISLFEVYNEHIYDLLDPKHPEVQVLEDARGKIKFKGLSEAIPNSVSEFHKLYSLGYSSNRRSHKGLILRIISKVETSSSKTLGKMTFVDLAGYEDARRKSCEGAEQIENGKINKSLYALLNVVQATNANEARVPFRENKLTRLLQDSFGLTNRVLLLNCLNPFFCQDTVFTLRLASRSCHGINRTSINSIQKSKYLEKSSFSSAIKGKLNVGSSANKQSSFKSSVTKGKLIVGSNANKQAISKSSVTKEIHFVESSAKKQPSSTPYISVRNKRRIDKERKVEDKGKDATALEELKSPLVSTLQSRLSEINLEIELSSPVEEKSMSKDCVVATAKDEDTFVINAPEDTKPKVEMVKEYQRPESQILVVTPNVDEKAKAPILSEEGDNKEKENNSLCVNGEGSPPLSSRLRELQNNLRNLCNYTPIQMKQQAEFDGSCGAKLALTSIREPKTPVQDKLDLQRFNSPWEKFNTKSSGLKQSLADEYLKFINSASKEELKGLPGIGEKRATYILELREESPEPFKNIEDLTSIGLSAKQVNGMMKKVAGDLFN